MPHAVHREQGWRLDLHQGMRPFLPRNQRESRRRPQLPPPELVLKKKGRKRRKGRVGKKERVKITREEGGIVRKFRWEGRSSAEYVVSP